MRYNEMDEMDKDLLDDYLHDCQMIRIPGEDMCRDSLTNHLIELDRIIMSDRFQGYRFKRTNLAPYKDWDKIDGSKFEGGMRMADEPDHHSIDISGSLFSPFRATKGFAEATVRVYTHSMGVDTL